jgi:membrane-bound ClpP family serine protease
MIIDLLWSLGLMAAAVLILVAEMFLVSFGMLALVALGLAVASVVFAFRADPVAGWIMLVVAPVAAWYVMAWCMRRIRLAGLVAREEVTAAAGIRSSAARAGAVPGAEGVLLADALPTARARFAAGEVDVLVQGACLKRGARVRVAAIDGPTVQVVAAEAPAGIGTDPDSLPRPGR